MESDLKVVPWNDIIAIVSRGVAIGDVINVNEESKYAQGSANYHRFMSDGEPCVIVSEHQIRSPRAILKYLAQSRTIQI